MGAMCSIHRQRARCPYYTGVAPPFHAARYSGTELDIGNPIDSRIRPKRKFKTQKKSHSKIQTDSNQCPVGSEAWLTARTDADLGKYPVQITIQK